ncbi:uncharacterized protein [Labrus bergylta]|uniref:uncharacterized protein isoform X1 n=1 Tax=Labrus bergylta TaxID=56723 RepID=UPI0009B4B2FE|nr:uncharacterized protein LOC109992832 isoform X2 [Labrus bergylta]
MFMFYLLFFALHTAYGALLYADPGQHVTLPCVFTSSAKYMSWYKQVAGEKPQIMSSFYKHSRDAIGFFNQFKDKNRFSAQTGEGFYHLIISNVQESDSAMYYCGQTSITTIEFHEGIFLVLKDSSALSFIRQPASDPVKQGDAVTLSCTVHTGTCDGEHNVYWFKNSEESNPGLIYANGGRNDKCESKPMSQSLTCVYNLQMTSLNRSHAGTYYCAVVACGRILFGNGAKLQIINEGKFLIGTLTFTTLLAVLIALSACFMKKRNSCQSTESQATISAPSMTDAEGYQNKFNLYYAALSVNLTDRTRRQRDPTWSEAVYESVKH